MLYNKSMRERITKTKAEKRETRKRLKMLVSGKSVLKLQQIIVKKARASEK